MALSVFKKALFRSYFSILISIVLLAILNFLVKAEEVSVYKNFSGRNTEKSVNSTTKKENVVTSSYNDNKEESINKVIENGKKNVLPASTTSYLNEKNHDDVNRNSWSSCTKQCGGGEQQQTNLRNIIKCNEFPCPECKVQRNVEYGANCMESSFLQYGDSSAEADGFLRCHESCLKVDECERFSYNAETGDCSLLKYPPEGEICDKYKANGKISGNRDTNLSSCKYFNVKLNDGKVLLKQIRYIPTRISLEDDFRADSCQMYLGSNVYEGRNTCQKPEIVYRSTALTWNACQVMLNNDKLGANFASYQRLLNKCELRKISKLKETLDQKNSIEENLKNVLSTNSCTVAEPDTLLLIKNGDVSQCGTTCEVSEWSQWSSCEDVANYGWQTRIRYVTSMPYGSDKCPHLKESESCNAEIKKSHTIELYGIIKRQSSINCIVEDFGVWSSCSATCNSLSAPSIKRRFKRILQHHIPGIGKACSVNNNMEEVEVCNDLPACEMPPNPSALQQYYDIIAAKIHQHENEHLLYDQEKNDGSKRYDKSWKNEENSSPYFRLTNHRGFRGSSILADGNSKMISPLYKRSHLTVHNVNEREQDKNFKYSTSTNHHGIKNLDTEHQRYSPVIAHNVERTNEHKTDVVTLPKRNKSKSEPVSRYIASDKQLFLQNISSATPDNGDDKPDFTGGDNSSINSGSADDTTKSNGKDTITKSYEKPNFGGNNTPTISKNDAASTNNSDNNSSIHKLNNGDYGPTAYHWVVLTSGGIAAIVVTVVVILFSKRIQSILGLPPFFKKKLEESAPLMINETLSHPLSGNTAEILPNAPLVSFSSQSTKALPTLPVRGSLAAGAHLSQLLPGPVPTGVSQNPAQPGAAPTKADQKPIPSGAASTGATQKPSGAVPTEAHQKPVLPGPVPTGALQKAFPPSAARTEVHQKPVPPGPAPTGAPKKAFPPGAVPPEVRHKPVTPGSGPTGPSIS